MFWDDFKREIASRDLVVVWAGASLVVALAGPFGSYFAVGFWMRLAFWLPVNALAIFTYYLVFVAISRVMRGQRMLVLALLASTVFAAIASPAMGWLFDQSFGVDFLTFSGLIEIFTLNSLVSLGTCLLRHPADLSHRADTTVRPASGWAARFARKPQPAEMSLDETPQTQAPQPRLMERLHQAQRGDLIRLQGRDHYVVVTTSMGQASLLLRFSDAVAEVAPVAGAQVHRSWWVNWDAVTGAVKDGDRLFIEMRDGGKVPVSRANRAKLVERGLI